MNIKKHKLNETDMILYVFGLVALGIAIAAVLLYYFLDFNILNHMYPCMFRTFTGLPCPGCGGTRSLLALVNGRILDSLYYYPPLIYAVIVYVIYMVRCFAYRHFGVWKVKTAAIVKCVYIFLGIMIVQWIAKLVAILAFGYRWV